MAHAQKTPNIRRFAQCSVTDTDAEPTTQGLRTVLNTRGPFARWGFTCLGFRPDPLPPIKVVKPKVFFFCKNPCQVSHGQPHRPMGRRGTPDDHQGRLAGPSGHFGETFPKTTAVPSQKGTFWCKKKNWAPQTDCATTPLPRQHALCPYWLLRVAGGHPAALLRLRALGSVAPPLKSPDFIAAEHNPPARLHENGRGPMEAPNGPPWLGLQPLRPCSGPWPAPRSRPTTKRKSSLDPPRGVVWGR